MKQTENIELPKELITEQVARDLANKKEELGRAQKNLVEHELVLDLQRGVLSTLEVAKPVILAGMKITRPFYEYESTDEFTAFNLAQETLKFKQLQFQLEEQSIPSMIKTIDAKVDAINNLMDTIADMEAE